MGMYKVENQDGIQILRQQREGLASELLKPIVMKIFSLPDASSQRAGLI